MPLYFYSPSCFTSAGVSGMGSTLASVLSLKDKIILCDLIQVCAFPQSSKLKDKGVETFVFVE